MKYSLHVNRTSHGNYYSYRYNYREGGKVKTKSVYLGAEEIALELISDFNSKKPLNERLLSFSGEEILSKILDMLDFRRIIDATTQIDAKFGVGQLIKMVVLERVLYGYSKWRLAQEAHEKSIFSLHADIPPECFTEGNIYNYMDYIYPNLDEIQKELVKKILNIKGLEFNELIIDGTSVCCYGLDDPEEGANGTEKRLKRVRGYSRDKRPDLAQINLMLGVSDQYIPLLFETYSGNTIDATMFKELLEKCKRDYSLLFKTAKNKYLVFDKGNNSESNFKELDALCEKWGFNFVASVRPSLKSIKKALSSLETDALPVLYHQKRTKIRGTIVRMALYNKERNVLLYVNEEIALKKQAELLEKIKELQDKIVEINNKKKGVNEKLIAIEKILRKKRLLTCFKREFGADSVSCTLIDKKLGEKMASFGKFALFTNDAKLDAASMIRIYKNSSVVEQEFHLLKDLCSIRPINHREPRRIKSHFAIVLWGMLALALLRWSLMQRGIVYSFETLITKIKEGHVSVGDYVYPNSKSFRVKRTLNVNPELEAILTLFRLDYDYFEIELSPTSTKKKVRK